MLPWHSTLWTSSLVLTDWLTDWWRLDGKWDYLGETSVSTISYITNFVDKNQGFESSVIRLEGLRAVHVVAQSANLYYCDSQNVGLTLLLRSFSCPMIKNLDNKHVLNLKQESITPSGLCVVPENKFLVFLHGY